MKVSFYLTRNDSTTATSIFARICYMGYQLKFYTPESIHPSFWNSKTKRAKETQKFKQFPEFNTRMSNLENEIHNIYRKFINDNEGSVPQPQKLKELLERQIKTKASEKDKLNTLFGFFEVFIQQISSGVRTLPKTGKPFSKATIQIYKNTLNRLKIYSEKKKCIVDFDDIDLTFYSRFTAYLSKVLNLAPNTMGKDIKVIKAIMSAARELGLTENIKDKNKSFSVTSENTESIYLSVHELQQLEVLDLSNNVRLDNVRDLFLIGCYTGLRYSDYSILKPEQIIDGIIETIQVKTGASIAIPVLPPVERILNKHNGNLPPAISNQKTNKYLKELGQLLEGLNTTMTKTYTKGGERITETYFRWELLSSHTARRSFATNAYRSSYPIYSIMKLTGHKTEKSFMRYIQIPDNEHAKMFKLHYHATHTLKAV